MPRLSALPVPPMSPPICATGTLPHGQDVTAGVPEVHVPLPDPSMTSSRVPETTKADAAPQGREQPAALVPGPSSSRSGSVDDDARTWRRTPKGRPLDIGVAAPAEQFSGLDLLEVRKGWRSHTQVESKGDRKLARGKRKGGLSERRWNDDMSTRELAASRDAFTTASAAMSCHSLL